MLILTPRPLSIYSQCCDSFIVNSRNGKLQMAPNKTHREKNYCREM